MNIFFTERYKQYPVSKGNVLELRSTLAGHATSYWPKIKDKICQHQEIYCAYNLWRTSVFFVGPLIPLFWTTVDIWPRFHSLGGLFAYIITHLCAMDSIGSTLVQHLLTSSRAAWQPSPFDPRTLYTYFKHFQLLNFILIHNLVEVPTFKIWYPRSPYWPQKIQLLTKRLVRYRASTLWYSNESNKLQWLIKQEYLQGWEMPCWIRNIHKGFGSKQKVEKKTYLISIQNENFKAKSFSLSLQYYNAWCRFPFRLVWAPI